MFFKLKDHPSAVATWLADIVTECNERQNAASMLANVNADATVAIHSSLIVDRNDNEKQATLEEAGDSSFLL